MKKNNRKVIRITVIVTLVAISNVLMVVAAKAAELSAWPAWFGEPELPQELLNNIH